MSILIMVCIVAFLFGCLLYRTVHDELGASISVLSAAMFVGVLLYGTFEPYSYTYEDITPNAIVRTSEGFTIATIPDRAVASDKAVVYISSETNIFIRETKDYNAWGWKLSPKKYELVIK